MRNSLLLVFAFAALSADTGLCAQDLDRAQPDRLELYAGYSYVRFNINSNVAAQPPSQVFNANGGGGELQYNISNWLGVLGNVDGYWATNSTTGGAAMPYLFGPRVSLRRGKVSPFAQILFGGVLTSSGIQTIGWQSHFAMTVGGGIDVRISRNFSIRPIDAEYFLTKIPDGLNNRQNSFRYGAGVVWRFG